MRILIVGMYENDAESLRADMLAAVGPTDLGCTVATNVLDAQEAIRLNDVVSIVFISTPGLFIDLAQRLVPNLTMPGSKLARIIVVQSPHEDLPMVIERVAGDDTAAIIDKLRGDCARYSPVAPAKPHGLAARTQYQPM